MSVNAFTFALAKNPNRGYLGDKGKYNYNY